MALLKPNQLSPTNSVIDATAENRFSWQTNGAKQTGYRVYIYNNTTDSLLHDSTEIVSPNEYYDLPSATLTNGTECKWYVTAIANSNSQDSEYEFFETNATPIVGFISPDFSYEERNTIEVVDTPSNYTSDATLSEDTILYLSYYSDSSVKMVATLAGGSTFIRDSLSLDLTKFANGTTSTTSDLLTFVFYVTDLAYYNDPALYIRFDNDDLNFYSTNVAKSSISTGWNYLEIAKSSFSVGLGSPTWDSITKYHFNFKNVNIGEYMHFQAIELRKVLTDDLILGTQDYTFEMEYSQDQGTGLKAYKFILSDSDGAEIEDTGWLYDFDLTYEFTGFENRTSYQIEGNVLSQNEQESTTGVKNISILYSENSLLPDISVTTYDDSGYINIDFSNLQSKSATYSDTASTPIYTTGKFEDYGIEIPDGETLDLGELTTDTEFTITAWIEFITGLDGHFLNINDMYYYGYDATLQRFYYFDGTFYEYSGSISLATITGSYVYVGVSNDDFIIVQNESVKATIDTSNSTFPTSITKCEFQGYIILDNAHGEDSVSTYSELLNNEVRNLISATPTISSPASPLYNVTESIEQSTTRNLLYTTNGTTGYIYLLDLSASIQDSITFATNNTRMNTQLLNLYDDVYFLGYQDSASGYCRLKTISISSDTISTLDTQITNDSNDITEVSAIVMDTGIVLVAYRDSTSSKSYVEVVYAGNFITPYTLYREEINDGNDAQELTLVAINSTEAVLYYFDVDNTAIKNIHITREANYKLTLGNVFTAYDTGNSSTYMTDAILVDSTHITYAFAIVATRYVGITDINNVSLVNNYTKEIVSPATFDADDMFKKITSSYYTLTYNENTAPATQILSLDSSYNIIVEDSIQHAAAFFDEFCVNSFNSNSLYLFYIKGVNWYQILLSNFQESSTTTDNEAVWSSTTKFLANFEETLNSGNVPSDIVSYRLKRLAEDGSLYQTLANLDVTDYEYNDMRARNNVSYTYALHAIDTSGNEDSGTSASAELDFYGWVLTDNTNIYKFDLENNSSNISSVTDLTVFDNYTQYPTIGYGERNYRKGSLQTNPYTYTSSTGTYNFTISLLDTLREFINSSTTKYLKNTKGEVLKIITSEFSYKYMDKVPDQIYEISFDWIEVGIGEEGLS